MNFLPSKRPYAFYVLASKSWKVLVKQEVLILDLKMKEKEGRNTSLFYEINLVRKEKKILWTNTLKFNTRTHSYTNSFGSGSVLVQALNSRQASLMPFNSHLITTNVCFLTTIPDANYRLSTSNGDNNKSIEGGKEFNFAIECDSLFCCARICRRYLFHAHQPWLLSK